MQVAHALPLDLKKKLLFFATGTDRVPIKVRVVWVLGFRLTADAGIEIHEICDCKEWTGLRSVAYLSHCKNTVVSR